jgi:hypothetical protein
MTPSSSIHDRSDVGHACWRSVSPAQARVGSPDSPAVVSPTLLSGAQIDRAGQPLHSGRLKPATSANSPSARGTAAAPPPAISCLGASRTPAARQVDSSSCRRPRNLHRSRPHAPLAITRGGRVDDREAERRNASSATAAERPLALAAPRSRRIRLANSWRRHRALRFEWPARKTAKTS